MTDELMKVWDRYATAAINALIRERAKRQNLDFLYTEIERAIDA